MALSKVDPNFLNVSQVGGRRNLIINGAMQVAQRGTSATGVSSAGYYTVDRWAFYPGSVEDSLDYTMSQSSDAPDGFGSSLKMECTTTGTVDSDHNVYVRQFFEGQDMQGIGFGTPNAKSLTASFWVKSSKTGSFTLSIYRQDNTRTTGLAYTINSANTWEYKTLTFGPDTTGALDNDNAASMQLAFFMTAGSDQQSGTFTNGTWASYVKGEYAVDGQVNIATSGDTFQITGVQLEIGDTATPFEHRSYGEEVMACQRYYIPQLYSAESGYATGASQTARAMNGVNFPVVMRDAPDITLTVGTLSNGSNLNASVITNQRCHLTCTASSAGSVYWTCNLELDAEL